ncbi:MAG: sodium ion-translocating decarboxylase subunit beta [Christensenellaceae bacterium]|nr:sodium ion-translocating decarboxylase subunit beta [Christensenellaceae bacterium]
MQTILNTITSFTWQQGLMILVGIVLIYLAIKKEMEPSLLLPLGFGVVLVNIPGSGAIETLRILFDAGCGESELFPLLLFIGIGAMIDFGPLLSNPKMLLFGGAAQFGIFFTLMVAVLLGFSVQDAASTAIIAAADGPTAIFVSNYFKSGLGGAVVVAAYSYMALVPMIQPPVIKLMTTKKERMIRMSYVQREVPQVIKIIFPVVVTIVAGIVAPKSISLVGFLMYGNLLRECGVLRSISETAQTALSHIVTIFLGITVAFQMRAESFVRWDTLLVLALGLLGFVFDTIGGVLFAKFLNLFLKKENRFNPMIGAAGISAFPMSSRVVSKMARDEDPYNFILMQATAVNVSGQIASVIAGGLLVSLVDALL